MWMGLGVSSSSCPQRCRAVVGWLRRGAIGRSDDTAVAVQGGSILRLLKSSFMFARREATSVQNVPSPKDARFVPFVRNLL